jgi:peptide/nickel transport system ATP-binding protein
VETPLTRPSSGTPAPNGRASREVVLSVRDLWVEYWTPRGGFWAVRGATFDLHRGESLALIGESGSGKTTLGLALTRLLPRAGRVPRGQVVYHRDDGQEIEVLRLGDERLRRFRWEECAMVFQGAQNVFNPVLTIRDHFLDTYRAHHRARSRVIEARATELLSMVQLDPDRVLRSYPHELSGGMRQRVLIALSLLLSPQVLILDEPTTALDILTQRAIIDVLRRLKDELGFATIFISHDLSLAAELADWVATMYAGRLVELAPVKEMFYGPAHPYTAALLDAVPTVVGGRETISAIPGSPPDLRNPPAGCPFHPRCAFAVDRCKEIDVPTELVTAGHEVACIRWRDVRRDRRPAAAPAG